MLSSTDEEERRKAATLSVAKRRFQDMIDELFSYTQKDRPETERYRFLSGWRTIIPYKLSSGEKQMPGYPADRTRAGQQPLCIVYGSAGSLPSYRMAAETDCYDT